MPFHDINRHNELRQARNAFLKTWREYEAERKGRRCWVNELLVGLDPTLLNYSLEIPQMKRGQVMAKGCTIVDHEKS